MHYHYAGDRGDWDSQAFAFAQITRRVQSIAGQYSDVPEINGQSSSCLKQILLEEDVGDLEVLFRHRGIRTLDTMRSLTTNQQSVLSLKLTGFFEVLGVYPIGLENKLNYLFGSCATSERGLGNPDPLTHLDYDTQVTKELGAALSNAAHIYGWENYIECTRKVKHSRELIQAACLEVTWGLALLGIGKQNIKKKVRIKSSSRLPNGRCGMSSFGIALAACAAWIAVRP